MMTHTKVALSLLTLAILAKTDPLISAQHRRLLRENLADTTTQEADSNVEVNVDTAIQAAVATCDVSVSDTPQESPVDTSIPAQTDMPDNLSAPLATADVAPAQDSQDSLVDAAIQTPVATSDVSVSDAPQESPVDTSIPAQTDMPDNLPAPLATSDDTSAEVVEAQDTPE